MAKKIVTHNGNFHTDDIFAVATLLLLYPDAEVIRSRDPQIIDSADIVVDTGLIYDSERMRFDHHQTGGAGTHRNGIEYASFGLVWKEFGEQLAGSVEARDIIEEKVVIPVDAIDNGIKISDPLYSGIREYTFSDYLYSFGDRGGTDPEDLYALFMQLVSVAQGALKRECDGARRLAEDSAKVREIINKTEDKRIIVLPEVMSWRRATADFSEVLYVISPRREGGWGVKSPRIEQGSFETRKPMPEAWLSDTEEQFRSVTGVSDAQFMHRGRWYAAAKSKEGAVALAKKALEA